jgi:aminoglycoside phosphotransferase (APT) family kinase protein
MSADGEGADSGADDLRVAVEQFLAERLGSDATPQVVELRRSGTGTSRENWPFDAEWTADGRRERHRLILRRDPPSAVLETARSTEFRLLQRLADTSFHAPVVHWLDADGASFRRPSMIVTRYEGSADRAVLRKFDPMGLGPARQVDLAREFCDVLCHLHQVDVDAHATDADPTELDAPSTEDELERWRLEFERQALEPQPAMDIAMEWLRDNVPPPPVRNRVVHGDFRPANILIKDGKVAVVLDWETARLGDPIDDVGWYTAPLYRKEHFIPGAWEPADFVRRYEEKCATKVNPSTLRFWQVFATFRLAVMALTGIRAFVDGRTDRAASPADAVIAQVLSAAVSTPGVS